MTGSTNGTFETIWRANGRSGGHSNGLAEADAGRLLSEIAPEKVGWVWAGRIPEGKLTIVEGDPGLGKSALSTDVAARVSVGRNWPDDATCEPGGVVLLNAEDGLSDTVRPRLDAAGGDASKVLALATVPDGDSERLVSIPEDLPIIRRGIERVDAKLVIVDPLMAFLTGTANSHRDQDVRRALAPLAALAQATGAAVVVVRHLNKGSGGNPLYRGGGSIGIVGAARSALLVAQHPEDEQRRVLAGMKNNLSKPAPSLMFELTEAANGAARVEWKGETVHAAAALLAGPADPEERSAVDEAAEFLRDALQDYPVWSKQVKKEARAAEISEATLRRAKTVLGVRSVKEGDGSWSWSLPEVAQGHRVLEHEHLGHLATDGRSPVRQEVFEGDHNDRLRTPGERRIDKPDHRDGTAQGAQEAQGAQGLKRAVSEADGLDPSQVPLWSPEWSWAALTRWH